MTQPWRTVRVFISSTFRDMHAERDHLVRIVFRLCWRPLLNRAILTTLPEAKILIADWR